MSEVKEVMKKEEKKMQEQKGVHKIKKEAEESTPDFKVVPPELSQRIINIALAYPAVSTALESYMAGAGITLDKYALQTNFVFVEKR